MKKSQELHTRLSHIQVHETEELGTGYFFYKYLYRMSRKEQIPLKLPDALVFGFGFTKPTLIYTDEAGLLQFRKGIEHFQYDTLLDVFQNLNLFQSRQGVTLPLLIIKIGNGKHNRILLRRSDAYDEWRSREKNPEQVIMQHYILPKGRKACKMRAVLKPAEFKLFTISNKRRIDGKRDPNPKQSLISACGTLEEARRLYGTRFQPLTNNTKAYISPAPENQEENPIVVNVKFELDSERQEMAAPGKPPEQTVKIQDQMDSRKMLRGKLLSAPDFDINSSRLKARAEHSKEIEFNIEGILNTDQVENKDNKRKPPLKRVGTAEDTEEIIKLFADTKASSQFVANRINRTKMYTHLLKVKDPLGVDRAFERSDSPLPGSLSALLRERYCTDASDHKKTDIYEVKSAAVLTEVEKIMKQLWALAEKQAIALSELVCDFTEDVNGEIWFLKLKSYSYNYLDECQLLQPISPKVKKKCAGKHCTDICPEDKNMVLTPLRFRFQQTDELERPRPQKKKRFFITKRLLLMDTLGKVAFSGREVEFLLKPQLLETVEVCENCYKIYTLKEAEANHNEAKVKRAKTAAIKQGKYLRKLVEDVNTLIVDVVPNAFSFQPRPQVRSSTAALPPLPSSSFISSTLTNSEMPIITIDSSLIRGVREPERMY